MVTKVRERLTVSKQIMQKLYLENLKQLNKVEGKEMGVKFGL
jgi:hypothetical protein